MDKSMYCKAMKSRSFPEGFSYIEVVLTSLIMGLLMVAGLRLFANLGHSRQACLQGDDAMLLAVEMMEEIKGQSYRDPNGGTLFGVEAGETTGSRSLFDDVDDYNGWSSSPPKDRSGATLDEYADYTRSIQVRFIKSDNFDDGAGSDEGFKEVVISIYRGGQKIEQQKYVIADINWGVEIEDDD